MAFSMSAIFLVSSAPATRPAASWLQPLDLVPAGVVCCVSIPPPVTGQTLAPSPRCGKRLVSPSIGRDAGRPSSAWLHLGWKILSNSAIISAGLRNTCDESSPRSSPQLDLSTAARAAVRRAHRAYRRPRLARAALAVLLRSLSKGRPARGGGRADPRRRYRRRQ